MQEVSGVTNLQTELNYLDSFKSYCNSSDFGFLSSGGGAGGWGVFGVISYSLYDSGMFRGKESSNRIELSQLVQDLLNFGVLGSLLLWGWGGGWMGVGGGWGCPPHTCTCTHVKHDNFMQMAAPIGGIPGNSLLCHRHMCMHVHMCGGHLLTTPHPIHPPTHPPGGDPRNQSKFNST